MSFKPKVGETYWMVNSRFKVIGTTFTGGKKGKARVAAKNSFKTREEAQAWLNGHPLPIETECKGIWGHIKRRFV